MAYVDFEFYQNTFNGRTIPDSAFESIEYRAEAFVNNITFNRINRQVITDAVKNSICAVAEQMYLFDLEGGIKTSETTGSHSVTYRVGEHDNVFKRLEGAAAVYLVNTGLMFRGVK